VLVELEYRHRGTDPTPTIRLLEEEYGLTGWSVWPTNLQRLNGFDVMAHQQAFLDQEHGESMPDGYVHDFVFTTRDIGPELYLYRHPKSGT
jgi:hypothetical protein